MTDQAYDRISTIFPPGLACDSQGFKLTSPFLWGRWFCLTGGTRQQHPPGWMVILDRTCEVRIHRWLWGHLGLIVVRPLKRFPPDWWDQSEPLTAAEAEDIWRQETGKPTAEYMEKFRKPRKEGGL